MSDDYPGHERCSFYVKASQSAANLIGWSKMLWYGSEEYDQQRALGRMREAIGEINAALAEFDATRAAIAKAREDAA